MLNPSSDFPSNQPTRVFERLVDRWFECPRKSLTGSLLGSRPLLFPVRSTLRILFHDNPIKKIYSTTLLYYSTLLYSTLLYSNEIFIRFQIAHPCNFSPLNTLTP